MVARCGRVLVATCVLTLGLGLQADYIRLPGVLLHKYSAANVDTASKPDEHLPRVAATPSQITMHSWGIALPAFKSVRRVLQFVEIRHVALPMGFIPDGIAVCGKQGRSILWANDRAYLLFLDNAGTPRKSADVFKKPLAVRCGVETEVYDAGQNAIIQLSSDGRTVATRPLPYDLGGPIETAVFTAHGLVVGGRGPDSTFFVARVGDRQPKTLLRIPFAHQAGRLTAFSGRLATSHHGVLLVQMNWPYALWSVTIAGDSLHLIAERKDVPRDSLRAAVSAVEIGPYLVQTMVELTTGLRTFDTFTFDGVLISSKSIDAPLGFIGSVEQKAFAVRNLTPAELVVYRWSLVSHQSLPKEESS